MLTLETIKDVVTIVVLIVTGAAAWAGLNNWRNQTAKTSDRDLARRALTAVLRLRDAMQDLRDPLIWADEFGAAVTEVKKEYPDIDPNTISQNRAVYARRWKPIMDTSRELSVALVELEAFWGKETKESVSAILTLRGRLYAAVNALFMNEQHPLPRLKELYEEDLYKRTDEAQDDFTIKLNEAVASAEIVLRDKMKL